MGNDRVFDEVYKRDFRWPRKGDRPFVQSENRHANAEIARHPHSRFVMMFEGYKRAADILVEQSTHDRFDRAALVYPIVFNYRHFIELSLKYIIATYGGTVGIAANWNDHELDTLWRTFGKVLKGYGNQDSNETDPIVAEIVAEFAKLDPRSFSFRYPVDRNGKPVRLSEEEVDLAALADVMHGLHGYFMGCDGYLDSLQSAGP